MAASDVKPTIVPGKTLPSQPWWPQLHSTIIESFQTKDATVFPPTWTRLNADPTKGAQGLADELGDNGYLAIIFDNNDTSKPIACGGILPYRGDNWINDVESNAAVGLDRKENDSLTTEDWEICCFCVHPSHRRRGLARHLLSSLLAFIKPRGARRLLSNYAINETGTFWRNLGFVVVPGAGGMLPKGFQVDVEKEGLRGDVYFEMGVKRVL